MHRLLFALVLPLSGCFVSSTSEPSPEPPPNLGTPTSITSGNLATSEISASLSAQSDGKTITVYAALLHDLKEFVRLDAGDYLTASIGPETIVLSPENTYDVHTHYVATFPAGTGEQKVTVALLRRNGKEGAPSSSVVIPAAFTVTSIPPVAFRPGEPLKITVAPSLPVGSRNLEVVIEGPCLAETKNTFPLTLTATGEGSVDTTHVAFDTTSGSKVAGCDVNVHVRRLAHGQIDSAFRSSLTDFEGLQVRTFSTAVIP